MPVLLFFDPSICKILPFCRTLICINILWRGHWTLSNTRYIKEKVEHYLLFMFGPPKNKLGRFRNKYICLHLLPVFYLIQSSSKQIICFDFRKQNSVLPIVILCTLVKQMYDNKTSEQFHQHFCNVTQKTRSFIFWW